MDTSMRAQTQSQPAGLSALWDNVRTIAYALALAMAIRFAIAQPFRIPSGSMQPTLMVGDYIVVTKWSYGYSKFSFAPLTFGPDGRFFATLPKRGDVVVFRTVGTDENRDKDFVKRLIGLPGDRIQMIDGVLFINGEAVKRESLGLRTFTDIKDTQYGGRIVENVQIEAVRETLPNGASYVTFDRGDTEGDNTREYLIPDGQYMMIGDDRDNSSDSRYEVQGFGLVPFDHLVGKAQFVFISFDQTTTLIKPWTLLTGIRFNRFLHGIN
jgi:signal peptidase I